MLRTHRLVKGQAELICFTIIIGYKVGPPPSSIDPRCESCIYDIYTSKARWLTSGSWWGFFFSLSRLRGQQMLDTAVVVAVQTTTSHNGTNQPVFFLWCSTTQKQSMRDRRILPGSTQSKSKRYGKEKPWQLKLTEISLLSVSTGTNVFIWLEKQNYWQHMWKQQTDPSLKKLVQTVFFFFSFSYLLPIANIRAIAFRTWHSVTGLPLEGGSSLQFITVSS